jgi:transglycosylase-like protein with SLT domain
MVKRGVLIAAAVLGVTLGAMATPALAQLSPAAVPSPLALSAIPPEYLTLYQGAARTCHGLPWQVLAGIGEMESDHGRSAALSVHGPTGYGGAEGPMQFEPTTFAVYAVRADRRHPLSPYDPADAIYTAARMLCAAGGGSPGGLAQAIYTYNHAGWYVNQVISLAARYSGATAGVPGVARVAVPGVASVPGKAAKGKPVASPSPRAIPTRNASAGPSESPSAPAEGLSTASASPSPSGKASGSPTTPPSPQLRLAPK